MHIVMLAVLDLSVSNCTLGEDPYWAVNSDAKELEMSYVVTGVDPSTIPEIQFNVRGEDDHGMYKDLQFVLESWDPALAKETALEKREGAEVAIDLQNADLVHLKTLILTQTSTAQVLQMPSLTDFSGFSPDGQSLLLDRWRHDYWERIVAAPQPGDAGIDLSEVVVASQLWQRWTWFNWVEGADRLMELHDRNNFLQTPTYGDAKETPFAEIYDASATPQYELLARLTNQSERREDRGPYTVTIEARTGSESRILARIDGLSEFHCGFRVAADAKKVFAVPMTSGGKPAYEFDLETGVVRTVETAPPEDPPVQIRTRSLDGLWEASVTPVVWKGTARARILSIEESKMTGQHPENGCGEEEFTVETLTVDLSLEYEGDNGARITATKKMTLGTSPIYCVPACRSCGP